MQYQGMTIEPPNHSQLIEALQDRRRQLELDVAQAQARLDEVRDLLGMATTGPRRRVRRQPPPDIGPGDPVMDLEAPLEVSP